jgi:hypothetical protein
VRAGIRTRASKVARTRFPKELIVTKKELLEVLADVPDDTPISSCSTGPLVVYRPAERDPDGVGLVTIDTDDADVEEYWPEEKGWKILYGCPRHDARYREREV